VAFQAKWDVFAVAEYRGGAVYKTRWVGSVWLTVKPRTPKELEQIAKDLGKRGIREELASLL